MKKRTILVMNALIMTCTENDCMEFINTMSNLTIVTMVSLMTILLMWTYHSKSQCKNIQKLKNTIKEQSNIISLIESDMKTILQDSKNIKKHNNVLF